MKSKATHATPEGRAYLALQAKARADKRSTDELLRLYALEGFLERLVSSPRANDLVLKGGVLLAAYDLRRPTRDVDFLAENTSNDIATVLNIIKEIIAVPRDDGFVYGEPTAAIIREDAEYHGVRVNIPCTLATAKVAFGVDLNVGDPVWPAPVVVKVARLLGGEITLRGYPLAMVFAEKLVTAVQRGLTNTRWRDFADVYMLSSRHAIRSDELLASIERVATYRKTALVPLAKALEGFDVEGQAKWTAWLRREQLDKMLPPSLGNVVREVCAFIDPLVGGNVHGLAWNPNERKWS